MFSWNRVSSKETATPTYRVFIHDCKITTASEFYMPTFRNTLFPLHRRVGMKNDYVENALHTYPPVKVEQAKCSETSAYKIQTPGNYPEESVQHSEHGESLKSRNHTSSATIATPIYSLLHATYAVISCSALFSPVRPASVSVTVHCSIVCT